MAGTGQDDGHVTCGVFLRDGDFAYRTRQVLGWHSCQPLQQCLAVGVAHKFGDSLLRVILPLCAWDTIHYFQPRHII